MSLGPLTFVATPLYGSVESSSRGSLSWFARAIEARDARAGADEDAVGETADASADSTSSPMTTPSVAAPVDATVYVTLEIVMPADAPAPGDEACDPSCPQLCIPHDAEDLDCHEMGVAGFTVLAPDPHALDDDGDGLGCEV